MSRGRTARPGGGQRLEAFAGSSAGMDVARLCPLPTAVERHGDDRRRADRQRHPSDQGARCTGTMDE